MRARAEASLGARALFEASRERTLAFVEALPDAVLRAWPDPDFSPLCWHLGHIAYTEALWLHGEAHGDASFVEGYRRRFDQRGCPKAERSDGYDRGALFAYLRAVRARSRQLLAAPEAGQGLLQDGYLLWFLACHEDQHRETMAYVLGMERARETPEVRWAPALKDDGPAPRVRLPGGTVQLGHDRRRAYDNERPASTAELAPFALDAHPVTAAAWERFMAAGGYGREALWDAEGWRWRQAKHVSAPRGWRRAGPGVLRARLEGWHAVDGREPVCGVSWWEARAFARYAGGRLPSEAEWEHAALQEGEGRVWDLTHGGPLPVDARRSDSKTALTDLLGNVWEWTGDAFAPRPGFEAFPYAGYSAPYFDGKHRVLRGGSFATSPRIARPRFRNWYTPDTRQVFAGLRLAYDLR